jgi:hypothetical protein
MQKNNLSHGSRPTLLSFAFLEPGSLRARVSQREDSATAAHPTAAHAGAAAARSHFSSSSKSRPTRGYGPPATPPLERTSPSAVVSPTTVPLCSAGGRNDMWLRRQPDRRPGEHAGGRGGGVRRGKTQRGRPRRRFHQSRLPAIVPDEVRVRAAAAASMTALTQTAASSSSEHGRARLCPDERCPVQQSAPTPCEARDAIRQRRSRPALALTAGAAGARHRNLR